MLLLAFGLAGMGQESSEAERYVEEAKKLAADGKFDEASQAMKQALDRAPRNDLYLALASDYERQAGLCEEGLAHARQAIKLNGKVGAYYVLAGANAYGAQDIPAAREHIQTVLKNGTDFGSQAVKAAKKVEALIVKKTYTLHWELDPRKGAPEAGGYRLALPRGDVPYQTVAYKVTDARSHRLVKTEANHVLYVVPQGTKPFKVSMEITVQPTTYKDKLAARKAEPTPRDVRPYLGASVGADPGSPAVKKAAAGLKDADPVQTVRNVTKWMKKNIDYKLTAAKIEKVDFKAADDILERRHAECYGYAVLFTALCRSAGVPARQIWGLYMKPDGSGFASHNWAEVYIGGTGWVPIDPQSIESLGMLPNTHIRFIMPMKATAKGSEALPQINLLYMSGGDIRYETQVEWLSKRTP